MIDLICWTVLDGAVAVLWRLGIYLFHFLRRHVLPFVFDVLIQIVDEGLEVNIGPVDGGVVRHLSLLFAWNGLSSFYVLAEDILG